MPLSILQPSERSEGLVPYSRELARRLYEGIERQSGEPYFKHPEKMVKKIEPIIKNPHLQQIAKSAGYLHDIPEERWEYIDVYNPFDDHNKLNRAQKVYLNDFLFQFGKDGDYVSYLVHRLTPREERYSDSLKKIFLDFHKRGILRILDIIGGILKSIDRNVNTNPAEKRSTSIIQTRYSRLRTADREALEKFYKEIGVIDAFRIKGSFAFDSRHMEKALSYKFQGKLVANAFDNLTNYIPMAESSLVAWAQDNDIYSRRVLRNLLKETMINSFRILEDVGMELKFNVYVVSEIGYNKAREMDLPSGYTTILKEVRNEYVEQKGREWREKNRAHKA